MVLVVGSEKPAGNRQRTSVVSFDDNHTDIPDSHDVNIIDSHSQSQQHNITTKLLRIFKSKKWKKRRKNNETEIVIDKPLSFPKVKLRKVADTSGEDLQKSSLKISKSLPIRKPVIVWEEIEEFQKLIPESPINRKVADAGEGEKTSVSTQTDIRQDIHSTENCLVIRKLIKCS